MWNAPSETNLESLNRNLTSIEEELAKLKKDGWKLRVPNPLTSLERYKEWYTANKELVEKIRTSVTVWNNWVSWEKPQILKARAEWTAPLDPPPPDDAPEPMKARYKANAAALELYKKTAPIAIKLAKISAQLPDPVSLNSQAYPVPWSNASLLKQTDFLDNTDFNEATITTIQSSQRIAFWRDPRYKWWAEPDAGWLDYYLIEYGSDKWALQKAILRVPTNEYWDVAIFKLASWEVKIDELAKTIQAKSFSNVELQWTQVLNLRNIRNFFNWWEWAKHLEDSLETWAAIWIPAALTTALTLFLRRNWVAANTSTKILGQVGEWLKNTTIPWSLKWAAGKVFLASFTAYVVSVLSTNRTLTKSDLSSIPWFIGVTPTLETNPTQVQNKNEIEID